MFKMLKRMFYEEKEISSYLICKYCNSKYNDPRILPCGYSLCYACIEVLVDQNLNGLNCTFCKQFHSSKNGFQKNINLAELTEVKPSEIYRSKKVEDLENKLKTLNQKIEELNGNQKYGLDKIKEYCEKIRCDIQLETEIAIEKLKNFNQELIGEINEYEKECKIRFETEIEYKEYLEKFCIDNSQFISKWFQYLNNFKVSDNEIQLATNETNKLLEHTKKEHLEFENKIFSLEYLYFEKLSNKIDSSSIGVIKKGSFPLCFEKQIRSFKPINLKQKLDSYLNLIKIKSFQDNYFVCAYRNRNNNVSLTIIDKQENIIKEQKNILVYAVSNQQINNLLMTTLNNKIFLVINCDPFPSFFKKYDEELNLINEIPLEFKTILVTSNNENVFLLRAQDTYCRLHVYDNNLLMVGNYGQNNENDQFYFPIQTKKLEVTDKHFIYLENKLINLMDRQSGIVTKTFKINSNDFVLYLQTNLLKYDSKLKILTSYDLNGNYVGRIAIEKTNEQYELLECSNKKLFFFNPVDVSIQF